jgi:hypothetical protein
MTVRDWLDSVAARAEAHDSSPDTVRYQRYADGSGAELMDLANSEAWLASSVTADHLIEEVQ